MKKLFIKLILHVTKIKVNSWKPNFFFYIKHVFFYTCFYLKSFFLFTNYKYVCEFRFALYSFFLYTLILIYI